MRKKLIVAVGAATAVVLIGSGAAVAVAGSDDDASERPITGQALARASQAALAHTGGGSVTDTEVGDEESYYEVEVTLDNGDQVDVQLDRRFQVVGEEAEEGGEEGEVGDDR